MIGVTSRLCSLSNCAPHRPPGRDKIGSAVRLLIIVDDIFEFQDGTLHFAPLVAIPALEGVRPGDPLELRRPDGTTIHTTL